MKNPHIAEILCEPPQYPIISPITSRKPIGTQNESFTCQWNYKWSNDTPANQPQIGTCTITPDNLNATWIITGFIECIGMIDFRLDFPEKSFSDEIIRIPSKGVGSGKGVGEIPPPRNRKNSCRKMVLFSKALLLVTNF